MSPLILTIMYELTQHQPITAVWIKAEYLGPATTWTVKLTPKVHPGEPFVFGGWSDTVTVKNSRQYFWLVHSTKDYEVFTAELIE